MPTESNADWYQLGATPLRKVVLYKSVNFSLSEGCLVASCPYGGPVAIASQEKHPSWVISLMTANGDLLSSIMVSDILKIYWTTNQKLVVLFRSGNVGLFSVNGENIASFDMNPSIRDSGFLFAQTYNKQVEVGNLLRNDTGFFIFDAAQKMHFVNSILHPLPWSLAIQYSVLSHGAQRNLQNPTCCTIVCTSTITSVILCFREAFFIGSQNSSVQLVSYPWMFTDGGQYIAAATSWLNDKIAFVHDSLCVQIVNNDLEYILHTIILTVRPISFIPSWCGGDVLVFRKSSTELTFYSMSGDHYNMSFFKPMWYDVDSDGVRIFQKFESYLITVVPGAMVDVFGLLSNKPGAYLFLAHQSYSKKDFLTFDYLVKIRKHLYHAVDQCLHAAANNFDIQMQKQLISAVYFGKSMFSTYDSEKFVYITGLLRCLNALHLIGIPISFPELMELGLPLLTDRLIELHHWPLALKICKTMNILTENEMVKIISHWTHYLLDKAALSGRKIDAPLYAAKIFDKIDKLSYINYADIAEVVYNKDKKNFAELANLLLERENDVNKRVQMLIKFGNVNAAFELANESQLPNLVYMVILHLKQVERKGELDRRLIRNAPVAAHLYQGFVREDSPSILLALYEQQDDFLRQALLHLLAAERENDFFDPKAKNTILKKVESCFNSLGNSELEHLVKSCSTLTENNANYDNKKRTSLINENVRETFIYAVGEGADAELAEQLKKDHKLTEKQIWRWTIDAFIRSKKKSNLVDMSYKKQFTGYMSFVEACVRCKDMNLALEFTQKLENADDSFKAYCLMGRYLDAAEVAFHAKDVRSLQTVLSLCRSGEDRVKILDFISSLKSG